MEKVSTRAQKPENHKIATLPLVQSATNVYASNVEPDICGYGFVPISEMFRGKLGTNLFVPRTKVSKYIKIQSNENISELYWSTYLKSEFGNNIVGRCLATDNPTKIHDKLIKELYSFHESQELADNNISIVCIIYKSTRNGRPFFDMQLGVTGTVELISDTLESPECAAVREIYEETSQTSTWTWKNKLQSRDRKTQWSGLIVGCGEWNHPSASAWCIGCTCDQKIRRAGFECCASGWGSCAQAQEAYNTFHQTVSE